MFQKSFTIVELLIIIGILIILTAATVPSFNLFQKESDLNNSVEQIINILRFAQNKTLASEGSARWGVYFSTAISPHQYTLFQGTSYALRVVSFDEVHQLPKSVEIEAINLADAGTEIVFKKVTGTTEQFGTISLRLITNPASQKSLYIESSGQVSASLSAVPSDSDRIKDSRHIHFDYNRNIGTLTENIILSFEGGVIETIVIADNLKDGQIYWQGEVDVLGEIQQLEIHTHRLNDFTEGTQFCIHRDRRYNNKSLKAELSDDPSGFLINYSADGLNTIKTSIYASDASWQ
ncbi:MAG: hypothetical protein ABIG29_00170 [Candidatus Nealsonbacteria bacterium]